LTLTYSITALIGIDAPVSIAAFDALTFSWVNYTTALVLALPFRDFILFTSYAAWRLRFLLANSASSISSPYELNITGYATTL
jgi:hypothetical protein